MVEESSSSIPKEYIDLTLTILKEYRKSILPKSKGGEGPKGNKSVLKSMTYHMIKCLESNCIPESYKDYVDSYPSSKDFTRECDRVKIVEQWANDGIINLKKAIRSFLKERKKINHVEYLDNQFILIITKLSSPIAAKSNADSYTSQQNDTENLKQDETEIEEINTVTPNAIVPEKEIHKAKNLLSNTIRTNKIGQINDTAFSLSIRIFLFGMLLLYTLLNHKRFLFKYYINKAELERLANFMPYTLEILNDYFNVLYLQKSTLGALITSTVTLFGLLMFGIIKIFIHSEVYQEIKKWIIILIASLVVIIYIKIQSLDQIFTTIINQVSP